MKNAESDRLFALIDDQVSRMSCSKYSDRFIGRIGKYGKTFEIALVPDLIPSLFRNGASFLVDLEALPAN